MVKLDITTNKWFCPQCKNLKDRTEFGFDSKSVGNISSWCKTCKSRIDKEYRDKLSFEKHCLFCNKDFVTNKKSIIYCSISCQSKHSHQLGKIPPRPKTGITLNCTVCKKKYYIAANRIGKSKFCSRSCLAKAYLPKHVKIHGFKPSNKPPKKYKHITVPDGRRLRIHRWVMEQQLGRPLTSAEHVHHIDGNTNNNDPANLIILTNGEHAKLHIEERLGRVS